MLKKRRRRIWSCFFARCCQYFEGVSLLCCFAELARPVARMYSSCWEEVIYFFVILCVITICNYGYMPFVFSNCVLILNSVFLSVSVFPLRNQRNWKSKQFQKKIPPEVTKQMQHSRATQKRHGSASALVPLAVTVWRLDLVLQTLMAATMKTAVGTQRLLLLLMALGICRQPLEACTCLRRAKHRACWVPSRGRCCQDTSIRCCCEGTMWWL